MRNYLFLILLFFPMTIFAQKNIEVEPRGDYKEVAVSLENDFAIIADLQSDDNIIVKKTIKKILKTPEQFSPVVLYLLSNILFEQKRYKEALKWFYSAQLGARIDANLCQDITARQGVGILNNRFGPPINQYAFQHIDLLTKAVEFAVDWNRSTKKKYDYRWLYLHGTDAFTNDTIPEWTTEEMEKIKLKTIDDWYNGFLEAVKLENPVESCHPFRF